MSALPCPKHKRPEGADEGGWKLNGRVLPWVSERAILDFLCLDDLAAVHWCSRYHASAIAMFLKQLRVVRMDKLVRRAAFKHPSSERYQRLLVGLSLVRRCCASIQELHFGCAFPADELDPPIWRRWLVRLLHGNRASLQSFTCQVRGPMGLSALHALEACPNLTAIDSTKLINDDIDVSEADRVAMDWLQPERLPKLVELHLVLENDDDDRQWVLSDSVAHSLLHRRFPLQCLSLSYVPLWTIELSTSHVPPSSLGGLRVLHLKLEDRSTLAVGGALNCIGQIVNALSQLTELDILVPLDDHVDTDEKPQPPSVVWDLPQVTTLRLRALDKADQHVPLPLLPELSVPGLKRMNVLSADDMGVMRLAQKAPDLERMRIVLGSTLCVHEGACPLVDTWMQLLSQKDNWKDLQSFHLDTANHGCARVPLAVLSYLARRPRLSRVFLNHLHVDEARFMGPAVCELVVQPTMTKLQIEKVSTSTANGDPPAYSRSALSSLEKMHVALACHDLFGSIFYPRLERLHLSHSHVSLGAFNMSLVASACPVLARLTVSHHSRVVWDLGRQWSSLKSLQILDCDSSTADDIHLAKCLPFLPNLRRLYIRGTGRSMFVSRLASAAMMGHLPRLVSLAFVSLGEDADTDGISEAIIQDLCLALPKLRKIELCATALSSHYQSKLRDAARTSSKRRTILTFFDEENDSDEEEG